MPQLGPVLRKLMDISGLGDEATVASRRALIGGGLLAAFWREAAVAGGSPESGISSTHWLVNRLTMGFTPAELALADSLGVDGYLDYHLDYAAIDDSALETRLAGYSTLTMTPYELSQLSVGQVIGEITEATILRSVFSNRQLFERVVEFWTDHFNIDITNAEDRFLKTVDDREVIRTHALGTFEALLTASAMSPAMLVYLDNASSIAGAPNENYARELMELHTLGVDGGYTQQDVEEVARCFTGWTIARNGPTAQRFTFQFRADRHDNGAKTVLGVAIPPGGGINDGLAVLNILATHPSTASFISKKLCTRFRGENPPPSLVNAVATTFASTGGDIKEMLRTLFHDPSATPELAPPRYKRPYHLFVSALRALGATIANTNGLRNELTAAGHVPFRWPAPNGYPDATAFWAGLILPRWNTAAKLGNSSAPQVNGVTWSTATFFQGVANTAAASADHIDQRLFGGAMNADEKARIRDYMLPDPPTAQRRREAVGLALSSPGFQWY